MQQVQQQQQQQQQYFEAQVAAQLRELQQAQLMAGMGVGLGGIPSAPIGFGGMTGYSDGFPDAKRARVGETSTLTTLQQLQQVQQQQLLLQLLMQQQQQQRGPQ